MRASNGTRRTMNPQSVAKRFLLPETVAALTLAAFLPFPDAGAAEFGDESTRISVDTTLSHGMSWRVADLDEGLIGVNSDDGARNYDEGLISNTSKFTTEIDVDAGDVGLFARFQGFIDFENRDGDRSRTPLTGIAREEVGDGLDVLDLYATTSFEVGDAFVDLRLGNQVLNWGESTFIQNGINIINPFDVSKLRKPGAELRDGLLPVPMISMSADVTPNLTLEGFYQAGWQETKVDPAGTYFSTNDYGTPGGVRAFIPIPGLMISDQGGIDDLRQLGFTDRLPGFTERRYVLSVDRAPNRKPKDTGQWGAALRYYAEALNNTEFGLYFINYHSRLPLASGKYGTGTGLLQGLRGAQMAVAGYGPLLGPEAAGRLAQATAIDHFGRTARYRVEYPEDLQAIGLSFNTSLGGSGWALQGEYSFHPDQPLQRSEEAIFSDGLLPVNLAFLLQIRDALGTPTPDQPLPPQYDTYNKLLGTWAPGYINRDLSQFQATATRVFGPMLGANSLVFVGEAALLRIHGLPDQSFSTEDAVFAALTLQPDPNGTPLDSPGSSTEGVSANSYGYRLATRLDYNNAIGPATLSPYLQFQHDVNGYSPSPSGAFEEGRTAVTLGVGMNYLERWRANLSFTNYNGDTNYLSDRDFVSFSLSYSF